MTESLHQFVHLAALRDSSVLPDAAWAHHGKASGVGNEPERRAA